MKYDELKKKFEKWVEKATEEQASEYDSTKSTINVSGVHFDDGAYAAFNHLVELLGIKKEPIKYSGTPLSHSFGKVDTDKIVKVEPDKNNSYCREEAETLICKWPYADYIMLNHTGNYFKSVNNNICVWQNERWMPYAPENRLPKGNYKISDFDPEEDLVVTKHTSGPNIHTEEPVFWLGIKSESFF